MVLGVGRVLDQAWMTFISATQLEAVPESQLFRITVVLVVGFVGGHILGEVLRRILKMTAMDEFALQSDLQVFLRKVNYHGAVSDFMADVVTWTIYLVTLLSVFYFVGSELAVQYSATAIQFSSKAFAAIIILITGVLLSSRIQAVTMQFLRTGSMSRMIDDSRAEVPVYWVVGHAAKWAGYTITVMIALSFLGVDTFLITMLAGIVALGTVAVLILASHHLVRNVLISMYLQMARTFTAGERIRIDGYDGVIEGIRPLYTKLRADDGNTYYVPNTKLIADVVTWEGDE